MAIIEEPVGRSSGPSARCSSTTWTAASTSGRRWRCSSTASPSSTCGAATSTRTRDPGTRHHRADVLDHQDHDGARRARAGRQRRIGPRCAGRQVLAEFGAEGKSEILVRQILGYTSVWPARASRCRCTTSTTTRSQRRCWPAGAWWEPGTAAGYTASPSEHLVSELVRRTTGRTLGEFFAEEIADPLDAEFHIGTGQEHDGRVSLLIQGSPDDPHGNEFFVQALLNPRVTHRRPGASRGAAPSWAG